MLFDAAQDGILGVARNGRCRFINRAGADLLGYDRADLVGQDLAPLIAIQADGSPATQQDSRPLLTSSDELASGQSSTARIRRADGTGLLVGYRSSPLYSEGEQDGLLVTFWPIDAAADVEDQRAAHSTAMPEPQGHDGYFRSLFEGLDDVILIADEQGRYLDANPAATGLLGYTRAELLGMRVADVVTAGPEWSEAEYARYLEEGRWRGELELMRRDGHRVVVEAKATVVSTPFGRLYVSVISDITERRRAEERLREEAQTIEALYQIGRTLSADLDTERIVQAVTDMATELTGAQFGSFFFNVVDEQRESYTLYTLSGAPHEAFAGFPMPRNTAIFGPTFRGEGVLRLDDVTQDPRFGQNAPYYGLPKGHLPVRSYLAVPVISRSGEVHGGLFFGHSTPGVFSERDERVAVGIATQAAIAIDNAQLLERAQEAARMRDDFLTIASHELKTPLTTVKGYVQLVRRALERREIDRERLDFAVERLQVQSNRLETLISDLLDTSRIQSGRIALRPEPTDLVALAEQIVERFVDALESPIQHRMVLEAAGPVVGSWDPGRLDQVLSNLLSNAVKYSPDGGEVCVSIERQGDHAVIVVTDEGIGIAPDERDGLFQPFVRGYAGRAQPSGTGLGLFISRSIVEQHGGKISVDRRPEGGSAFTVILPLATPERASS